MTPGLWAVTAIVYLVVGMTPTIGINHWVDNRSALGTAIVWITWPLGLLTIVVFYLCRVLLFLLEKFGGLLVER